MPAKKSSTSSLLSYSYTNEPTIFEIGVDEAGRGPLFGRVYAAAVILPKENTDFDYSKLKDSKKFSSKKKIEEVAEYIEKNALSYFVAYEDEKVIDEINILQATQSAMHKAIQGAIQNLEKIQTQTIHYTNIQLLIDGNYFKPIISFNKERKICETTPYICIEGGDNKYASIAAASILAKVYRDKYIDTLCIENPDLCYKYSIDTNKGYGAKKHLDGLKTYGVTQWHRLSFAPCARAAHIQKNNNENNFEDCIIED